jgi:hypothetical protein
MIATVSVFSLLLLLLLNRDRDTSLKFWIETA